MSEARGSQTQTPLQPATGSASAVALAPPARIAVVCAMEREVAGLVKDWRVESVADGFKRYRVFENERATVVVAGIGKTAASHAAELAWQRSRADVLISAGFAGATVGGLKVGGPCTAATVVDADSGARYPTLFGGGVLATAFTVLGSAEKRALFERFGAHAVDMEASAVAEVAQRHGAGFLAVKAISDLHDFVMPPMQKFVDERGDFHATRFVSWMLFRPETWARVLALNRNSRLAAATLEGLLDRMLKVADLRKVKVGEAHLEPVPSQPQRR